MGSFLKGHKPSVSFVGELKVVDEFKKKSDYKSHL